MMIRKVILLAILLVLFSSCSLFRDGGIFDAFSDDIGKFNAANEFFVEIYVGKNFRGSGFVVNFENKIIITCAHLFKGSEEEVYVKYKRKMYVSKIIKKDTKADVAIIRVLGDFEQGDELEIADKVDRGGDVYFIGSPLGKPSFIKTKISTIDDNYIYMPRSFIGGSSGGMLLQNGKVVGILRSTTVHTYPNTVFWNYDKIAIRKIQIEVNMSRAVPYWTIKKVYNSALEGEKNNDEK
jgi:S1-C subfamily serine protease